MKIDYPLRFRPLFRRYLWGGRRLESLLGKTLPAGSDYAESWEIVDRGTDQSVVESGPLASTTLGELIRHDGESLLGTGQQPEPFPLLFKFLDAHRDLSVQVHPNDDQAARLAPPDRGKTEAWVVLHTEPHSYIYAGLKTGVDRQMLETEIRRGTVKQCLHCFQPQPGDCVFIPAGTVHALGKGLVVAEIQQSSDITYRLFDWNRVGPDGQARPLHVQEGLEVIDFDAGPVQPRLPQPTDTKQVERLVVCDPFILDRHRFDKRQQIGGDNRFHILVVLSGTLQIERDPVKQPLQAGQTILLPARAGSVACSPDGPVVLLDIYMNYDSSGLATAK